MAPSPRLPEPRLHRHRVLIAGLVAACLLALAPQAARAGNAVDLAPDLSGAASGSPSLAVQYFEAGSSVIPTTGDFTIEAWAKLDSASVGGVDQVMIAQDSGHFLGVTTGSPGGKIWIGDGWASNVDMPIGRWAHIAAVRSGTTGYLYVDGHLRETKTSWADVGGDAARPTRVGRAWATFSGRLDGQVDQVRIWSVARTEEQVRDGMHAWSPTVTTGLRAHWDFNDGYAGTVANRVSGAASTTNLTPYGTPNYVDIASSTTVGGRIVATFPRTYLTAQGGWRVPGGVTSLDYLAVGGGGGGGGARNVTSGGGGGGQVSDGTVTVTAGQVLSPVVGVGGAGGTPDSLTAVVGRIGGSSSLTGVGVAVGASGGGGGAGGLGHNSFSNASNGASGGGGSAQADTVIRGAPSSGTAGQGNAGGAAVGSSTTDSQAGGGGGGAGGAGGNGTSPAGGAGGVGVARSITGTATFYGGGGGGGRRQSASAGAGGTGGGGSGGVNAAGATGTANTGGGGGGAGDNSTQLRSGGAGGSGVVIVSYVPPGSDVDTALDLNGSNQVAYAADDPSLRLGQNLTIEAWARPTGTCASVGCNVVIRETNYSIYGYGGTWWYRWKTTGPFTEWTPVNSGVPMRANEWQHLALVRDDTSGNVTLHVDGAARHTTTGTARWYSSYSGAPAAIGAYVGTDPTTTLVESFPGRIDQVRLWNVARTDAQIRDGMHSWSPATTTGLVAHWDFNGVTGTTAPNRSSSGASGTDLTLRGSPPLVDVKETTRNPSSGYTVVRFPRSYLTAQGGWEVPGGVTSVDYLVVGGGGGGGAHVGGGGGGGGVLTGTANVTGGAMRAIVVGQGGRGAHLNATGCSNTNGVVNSCDLTPRSGTGGSSTFGAVTVLGGGGGGNWYYHPPSSGATGGGSASSTTAAGTSPQGFAGGSGEGTGLHGYPTGGGGGAGGAGGNWSSSKSGNGGAGRASSITGTSVNYGGGGGGGIHGPSGATIGFGTDGGGNGVAATTNAGGNGVAGLGGGGGGGGNPNSVQSQGGTGGSGIVIVSYPQTRNPKSLTAGSSATVTTGTATSLGLGTGRVTGYTTETVRATLTTTTGTLSATANGTTLSGTGTATLVITGSQDAVNAAIGSATLTAASPIPTQVTLQIETAPTTQVVDGVTWTHSASTGHFYAVGSAAAAMDWRTARGLAEGLTLGGGSGFLASITSPAENSAVQTLLAASGASGWIGAEKRSTTQEWHWTGRDTARQFATQGSAVSGQYLNWGSGEPSTSEDVAAMNQSTGAWFDCGYTACSITRYVAEVEPPVTRSTHTVGFQRPGTVAALQGGASPLGLGASLIETARFGSESLTATLTASAGTVAVTAGTSVSGSSTSTVTITGSAANLNTALNSATVTPSGTGSSTVTLSYAPTAATSGSYVYRNVVGEERFYIRNANLPSSTGNLTWAGAYSGAQSRHFGGLTGYLTTITSDAERAWVKANVLGSDTWINGQDGTAEGQWLVDGRDAFAVVADGPFALPGQYAPWTSGQPDASGDGLLGNYLSGTGWDDYSETATFPYVVEFQPITTTYAIDVNSTAPSFTTVPLTDRSRQFTGSAAVGVLDATALDVSSAFTLEAWVKPSANTGEAVIAAKENAYALGIRNGDLSYALHNGTTWSWVSTGITIATGAWTHVAFTKSGADVAVHINGSATAAYANASQPATLNDSALPFTVGARGGTCTTLSGVCGTAYGAFFPGLIGDVRLWSTARTGAQIAASYDKRLASDVLTWFLDEASGSVAHNSAMGGGSALNGTYSATTASTDVPSLSAPTTIAVRSDATHSGFLPGYEAGGDVAFAVGAQGTKGTVAITESTGAFTYTPNANSVGLDTFTYTVSRLGATSSPQTIAASVTDVTAPTMTITRGATSVAGGGTTQVTFTSSEPTTNFTADDVTATYGTLSSFSGSGAIYTATFTGTRTAPGTATITVAAGSFTDAAGNGNTQGSTTIGVTSAIGGRTSFLGNGTIGANGTTYVVQSFTSGTTGWTVPRGVTSVDYLVVAGGGGGGTRHAGGGGAGGLRSSVAPTGGGASAETALTVTPGQTVTATVGGGGSAGSSGSSSSLAGAGFTTVAASGGGVGGGAATSPAAGGSGGGAHSSSVTPGSGTANEGYAGGAGQREASSNLPHQWAGGGGGGAGGAGVAAARISNGAYGGGEYSVGGDGGPGVLNAITGTGTCYAGGGGGGQSSTAGGSGTTGGGCGGAVVGGSSAKGQAAGSGAANTGSGGGGGGFDGSGVNYAGGAGGSGLVVVRYAIPAVSVPDLDAASDSGASTTDDVTNDATPTFTGSAPVGASVQLYDGSTATGSPCTADTTTGAWACTTGTLTAGAHAIKAVSTTVVDQTVTSESSTLTVTIDTTAPTLTLAPSAATASTALISYTLTGDEDIACSTVSNAAGTDFTLSGISSLGTVAQTSGTVCTIPATSPATVGERLAATLARASGFSVTDVAGNAQTAVAGSPAAVDVNRSTGATPAYPSVTGGGSPSGTAGQALQIGSGFDIADGAAWPRVKATVTTDVGALSADAGDSGATVGVSANTITITGSPANVEKVLNGQGTAYARVTQAVNGTATVTVAVEPSGSLGTVSGSKTFFNAANGRYYRLHEALLSYADASSQARADAYAGAGGYLATVTTQAEDDFVRGTVLAEASTTNAVAGQIRLGAVRCATLPSPGGLCPVGAPPNVFAWSPGANAPAADTAWVTPAGSGSQSGWTPWYGGEPGNGATEAYLSYFFIGGVWRWHDSLEQTTFTLREYGTSTSFTPATTTSTVTAAGDQVAPTVQSFADVSLSGTAAVFSATFSEPVTGMDASAVSVAGTSTGWTVGSVTGSGAGPYLITLVNANAPAGTVRAVIAGGVVQDAAANAYAGGSGPVRTINPVDRALGLNGASQYGATTSALFRQRSTFTIEAWSRPTSTTCASTARCEIVGRDGDANLVILNGTYQFVAYWATNANTGIVDSGVPARADEWTHTALVRDGTTVTLFVNGVAVKSATLAANTVAEYPSIPFRVGYIGYGSHYFPGRIDQVRYWSSARTAAQLAAGMHVWAPADTTGLIGFWDFNDGSGSTAANQAPNAAAGTDLTLTGSPTWPEVASSTTDAGGRTMVTFNRSYLSVSGGWTVPAGMANVDVLAVGGGGGGGENVGGGGGGGGSSEAAAQAVTAGGLVAVTVGVGGRPGGSTKGSNDVDVLRNGGAGSASAFGSVTAGGGGGGRTHWANDICGVVTTVAGTGGNGGTGTSATGGAGGANTSSSAAAGGAGSAGRASTITGTGLTYGGGGGAGGWGNAGGAGGSGGGGAGGNNVAGTAGTIGLGGGGGGGGAGCAKGAWGGSGVVVLAHDATAPSAPTIDLQAASDSGTSSTDDVTNDTTPTFAASGLEAGATIVLTATSGSSSATCTIAAASIASGAATCTFSPALAEGTWSVTARQADQMGNQSAPSTAVSITIDATAPTLTLAAAAAGATTTALSYTLTGDEAISCSTVSNSSGTDFALSGIATLGTIAQTSSTVCTIPATSSATVGERLDAVLATAGTFSVQDTAGNVQTAAAGSPATTVVNRSTGATPAYPGLTGAAAISAGAGAATAIGSGFDITDPTGVGWSSVTATVTTTSGTLTAAAGNSGATVAVASNAITVSGSIANVEKVLNSTGTAFARISSSSAGSATVTVTVEPSATHEIGGTRTFFSSATGHYYRLHETGLTWDAAHLAARQDAVAGAGGYLVTIRSAVEDDFVRGTVTGTYSSGYWLLGGRKCASTPAAGALCASNGTMQWVPGANAPSDDTTAVAPASAAAQTTWAPWAAGQPNDGASASPHLEYVYVDATLRYRFNDATRASGYSIREYGDNASYTPVAQTAVITFADTSVPTLGPIAKAGTEDVALAFTQADFTGTYADVNTSAPVSVRVTGLPATGELRLAGTAVTANQVIPYADLGGLTYIPAANANGPIAFTVTASDGTNSSSPATTVTMTLAAVNDAPTLSTPATAAYVDTAANDAFADATGTLGGADVDAGAVLTYGIQGVTPGAGALTVSSANAYGTLTVTRATGAYAFAPNRAAINARTAGDSTTFTVTVTDGLLSASATYTVSITAANDTPTLATPTTIAYADTAAADTFPDESGTLAGADRDAGQTLAYGLPSGSAQSAVVGSVAYDVAQAGTYGTLRMVAADGRYVFVPNAAAINALSADASETFSVRVSDGTATATATLAVTITAADDTPVLTAPTGASLTDTAATDAFPNRTGTLAATDAEGATPTYGIQGVTPSSGASTLRGAYGTLTVTASGGGWIYDPDDSAVNALSADAADAFTVTASDGSTTTTGTVTITITGANDTPTMPAPLGATIVDTAGADSFTAIQGALPSADAEGTARSYGITGGTGSGTVTKAGAYGTLVVDAAAGTWTYTPDASAVDARSANAADDFTVTASDGALSASRTLSFAITGVNDTPILALPTSGVVRDTAANSGSLPNLSGTLSATDAETASAALAYGFSGVTPSAGSAVFIDPDGYGTITLDTATGAWTFDPDEAAVRAIPNGSARTVAVAATATDGGTPALTDAKALRIRIEGSNNRPIMSAPVGGTLTDTSGADTFANVTGQLVASDYDLGSALTYGIAGGAGSGTITKAGAYGTLAVVAATGAWTYTPNASAVNGAAAGEADDFSVTVTDSDTPPESVTRTLSITVSGTNDRPILAAITGPTFTDTAAADDFADAAGTLSATDAEDSARTYAIESAGGAVQTLAGAYGTLTVVAGSGAWTYAPDDAAINALAQDATDVFTVSASDGSLSATRTLTVAITAANDTPTLVAPASVTLTDTDAADTFGLQAGALVGADPESRPIEYEITGGTDRGATVERVGTYGTLSVAKSNGAYAFTPDAAAINRLAAGTSEDFAVRVSDGSLTATRTLTVSIAAVKETPVITWADPAAIVYGTPLSATQLDATASGFAGAVAGTFAYAEGATARAVGDVLHRGPHSIVATFTPTDTAVYDTTTRTSTITVTPATQTINVAAASTSLVYGGTGTTLSHSFTGPNGGLSPTFARVSGPCTVSGADVSVTGAGDCVVTASVDEDDSTGNYADATSAPLTIAIAKATLTLTAQDKQKRATNADPLLTYLVSGYVGSDGASSIDTSGLGLTRAVGEVAGTYPITFTGTAVAADYDFQYTPATFTITDRDVPVVTWTTPAGITYGDPLTSGMLNASAAFGGSPVPGVFAYSIGGTPVAAGTMLGHGSHVITATFTPTDTSQFAPGSTAQVTVAVARKGLTVTGVSALDRDYDGTAGATLDLSGATLVGVVSGDVVALDTSAATATFGTADVGSNRPVTISGLVLTGASAGEYMLTQPSSTATVRAVPPGPPTTVTASAGDGQAVIEWSAPIFTGGEPIVGYTVTSAPAARTCDWTGGPLICRITGLTNGVSYTFTVVATNAAGISIASSASSPVTPSAPATEPIATGDDATVTPDGSAQIKVGCASDAGGCSAVVSMYVGSKLVSSNRDEIEAGQTGSVALDLPLALQRRLAAEGVLTVRVVTVVSIGGSTVTVESTIELTAPPAEAVVRTRLQPAADGSATVTATCEGTTVTRCDGEILLYASAATMDPRAGRTDRRVVVGRSRLAGPAGSKLRSRTTLTRAGRELLRRRGAILVTPSLQMKGATRGSGTLPSYILTRMTPEEWLRRALGTLDVGGRPRADLNVLLDQVRAGEVTRTEAARTIEREIIPARERARVRAAALPTPPSAMRPIADLLLRAFDQSLAANRAYVEWLRSDETRDERGWRASRRASATKAQLMLLFAQQGARYGIRVPPPTSLWP